MKNNKIIPITFMSGTGGNFLCSFIVAANNNNQSLFELSQHGNMHNNALKDIPTKPHSIEYIDQEKINEIINSDTPDKAIPYYTTSHICDLKLITEHFSKSIRIIYNEENIAEIGQVYVGKFFLDEKSYDRNLPAYYKMTVNNLLKYQSKFTEQDINDVLYISWDELYKGDINLFVNKISEFTSIDINRFNINNLLQWREKTLNGINQVKQLVK